MTPSPRPAGRPERAATVARLAAAAAAAAERLQALLSLAEQAEETAPLPVAYAVAALGRWAAQLDPDQPTHAEGLAVPAVTPAAPVVLLAALNRLTEQVGWEQRRAERLGWWLEASFLGQTLFDLELAEVRLRALRLIPAAWPATDGWPS